MSKTVSVATDAAVEAAELRAAVAELRAAVRQLCEPVQDGQGVTPSWLEQLYDSVAVSRNGGAGGRTWSAPANLGALVTLQQVSRAVRDLHVRVLSRSDRSAQQHLAGVLAEVSRWTSTQQVRAVSAEVAALAELVRARVLPATAEVPIMHPCPWCDRRMVSVWDATEGERVQRPALLLHAEHQTVRCQGCRSTWWAQFAARLIEQVAAAAPRDQRERYLLYHRLVAWANTEAVLAHYQQLGQQHTYAARLGEAHDRMWLVLAYYDGRG